MRRASLLLLILAAAPARAEPVYPPCYCTDRQGGKIELGEIVCLQVDGRRYSAQCQMSLNSPMWREVSSSCPPPALSSVAPDLEASPPGLQPVQPAVDTGLVHPKI